MKRRTAKVSESIVLNPKIIIGLETIWHGCRIYSPIFLIVLLYLTKKQKQNGVICVKD